MTQEGIQVVYNFNLIILTQNKERLAASHTIQKYFCWRNSKSFKHNKIRETIIEVNKRKTVRLQGYFFRWLVYSIIEN